MRRFFAPALPVSGRFKLQELQAHKLSSVLRLRPGDLIHCFSEAQGEYLCRVVHPSRGEVEVVSLVRQAGPAAGSQGPALAFPPLRPERTRFLLEKAVELGVGELLPLASDRGCRLPSFSPAKAQEWCIGAAEQCGRLSVPSLVLPPATLPQLLSALQPPHLLLVGDQAGQPLVLHGALPWAGAEQRQVTVLVGPEGGHSPKELAALAAHPCVSRVQLGQHTLRSETAALALLSCIAATSLAGR